MKQNALTYSLKAWPAISVPVLVINTTRRFMLCILILISVHTNCFLQTVAPSVEHPPNGHNSPYRISITDLTAQTNYYDGQPMKVIGYLNLESGGAAIYLNASDSQVRNHSKAVWLNLTVHQLEKAAKYSGHFIAIEGKFDGKRSDHPGNYCGSIDRITKLSPLGPDK